MTTEEVEIEVEETRTEELNICDGCGQKSSKIECKPGLEGSTEWISEEHQPYPLHFCSTDCVDSVRATGGVSGGGSSGADGWASSTTDRVLNPYDNVDKHASWGFLDYVLVGVLLGLGPSFAFTEATTRNCDHHWRVALFGSVFQIVVLSLWVAL